MEELIKKLAYHISKMKSSWGGPNNEEDNYKEAEKIVNFYKSPAYGGYLWWKKQDAEYRDLYNGLLRKLRLIKDD